MHRLALSFVVFKGKHYYLYFHIVLDAEKSNLPQSNIVSGRPLLG